MADKFPRPFGRYTFCSHRWLKAEWALSIWPASVIAAWSGFASSRRCCLTWPIPEYVNRFRDEAKVVVRLSHGNLVPVFDAGMVESELYLAMDYIDGKDLRAVWNRCAKKGIAFPST